MDDNDLLEQFILIDLPPRRDTGLPREELVVWDLGVESVFDLFEGSPAK